MKAIVLAGNSQEANEQWLRDLGNVLQPYFDEIITIPYDHWKDHSEINLSHEMAKVLDKVSHHEQYTIIAKSVGTAIASTLIQQGKISPRYCIYVGVPIKQDGDSKFGLENSLRDFPTPTVFIQNPDERFIQPKELRDLLDSFGVKKYEIINGKGDDHMYTIEEIVELVPELNQRYSTPELT